jgi:multidrug efflux pump subunit AcrB
MILLFVGSWRSTLIIAVSIPLSILTSVIVLSFLGETINIMTLGGLALAVGILVDDATVEIENINRNRAAEPEKDMREVVLDSASQIAVPALVSTLCICIVFLPMFFLSGVSKFLFVPLAEAVAFAMLASYFLSRTLVPTLAALRILDDETQQQREATASAEDWLQVSTNRYKVGVDNYLQVIIAQTSALANERNEADILRRRMDASVLLIKALGGGWSVTELPREASLR